MVGSVAIAEFSTPLPLRGQRRNFTGFPNYPARNQRAGTFNAAIILEFLSLRDANRGLAPPCESAYGGGTSA